MESNQWAYMPRDWVEGVEEVKVSIYPGWHAEEERIKE